MNSLASLISGHNPLLSSISAGDMASITALWRSGRLWTLCSESEAEKRIAMRKHLPLWPPVRFQALLDTFADLVRKNVLDSTPKRPCEPLSVTQRIPTPSSIVRHRAGTPGDGFQRTPAQLNHRLQFRPSDKPAISMRPPLPPTQPTHPNPFKRSSSVASSVVDSTAPKPPPSESSFGGFDHGLDDFHIDMDADEEKRIHSPDFDTGHVTVPRELLQRLITLASRGKTKNGRERRKRSSNDSKPRIDIFLEPSAANSSFGRLLKRLPSLLNASFEVTSAGMITYLPTPPHATTQNTIDIKAPRRRFREKDVLLSEMATTIMRPFLLSQQATEATTKANTDVEIIDLDNAQEITKWMNAGSHRWTRARTKYVRERPGEYLGRLGAADWRNVEELATTLGLPPHTVEQRYRVDSRDVERTRRKLIELEGAPMDQEDEDMQVDEGVGTEAEAKAAA